MILNKKTAMKIGAIGGALAALPSYLFAGDISTMVSTFDFAVLVGIGVRVALYSGLGALYAYMVPLPADKWTAMERGIIAPGLIYALERSVIRLKHTRSF